MIPGRGDPLQNSFSSFARKHQSTINKSPPFPNPNQRRKKHLYLVLLAICNGRLNKGIHIEGQRLPHAILWLCLGKKNKEIAISTTLGSTSRSKPLQFGVGLDAPKSCNKGSSLSSLLLGNANLLVFLINQLQSQVSRI